MTAPVITGGSVSGASVSATSLTDSGNLTFTGTGNRITGDFSNATVASRVAFQTSTANSNTTVGFIPNGTAVITNLVAYNNSDPTNASTALVQSNSTDARFASGISGTGTYLPLTMYTSGVERLRIDTSGNVGISTTSPSYKLDVNDVARVSGLRQSFQTGLFDVDGALSNYSATNGVYLNGNATGWLRLSGDGTNNSSASIQLNGGSYGESKLIVFSTNNAERMRITSSGNLLVGVTGLDASEKVRIYATGGEALRLSNDDLSGSSIVTKSQTASASTHFVLAVLNSVGTVVGRITHNDSNTTFATSSDYRLKENVAPMIGALAIVAQLKPCTYTWKSSGKDSQGFIAHELQEVIPDAVVGEKDAVDKEGNISPQGIDTSFLVATLTAAIQELKTELDSVKAELQTLKGA
jgi:hypothetical protein